MMRGIDHQSVRNRLELLADVLGARKPTPAQVEAHLLALRDAVRDVEQLADVFTAATSELDRFPSPYRLKQIATRLFPPTERKPQRLDGGMEGEVCPFCRGPRGVAIFASGREHIRWRHAVGCRIVEPVQDATQIVAWEFPVPHQTPPWRRENVNLEVTP